MPTCAVLLPVKGFSRAKARLAPVLGVRARADLARSMAERVVAACGDLPVTVACDDPDVRDWARGLGLAVAWVPGTDLDGAVTAGIATLDTDRVVVAHADLPQATSLAPVAAVAEGLVLVPDRHDDGTNVLALPRRAPYRFAYGPGSFRRHAAEGERLGLPLTVLRPPDLTWDVDVPEDLPATRPPTRCG
jgi:2-phospho-L-lactate/phosphoenolpyruvate guanylyltransferase